MFLINSWCIRVYLHFLTTTIVTATFAWGHFKHTFSYNTHTKDNYLFLLPLLFTTFSLGRLKHTFSCEFIQTSPQLYCIQQNFKQWSHCQHEMLDAVPLKLHSAFKHTHDFSPNDLARISFSLPILFFSLSSD